MTANVPASTTTRKGSLVLAVAAAVTAVVTGGGYVYAELSDSDGVTAAALGPGDVTVQIDVDIRASSPTSCGSSKEQGAVPRRQRRSDRS